MLELVMLCSHLPWYTVAAQGRIFRGIPMQFAWMRLANSSFSYRGSSTCATTGENSHEFEYVLSTHVGQNQRRSVDSADTADTAAINPITVHGDLMCSRTAFVLGVIVGILQLRSVMTLRAWRNRTCRCPQTARSVAAARPGMGPTSR